MELASLQLINGCKGQSLPASQNHSESHQGFGDTSRKALLMDQVPIASSKDEGRRRDVRSRLSS